MNKKVLIGVVALLVILGGVLLFYFGSGDLLKGSIRRGGFERGGALNLDDVGVENKEGLDSGVDRTRGGGVLDLNEDGALNKGGGQGCKGLVGCDEGALNTGEVGNSLVGEELDSSLDSAAERVDQLNLDDVGVEDKGGGGGGDGCLRSMDVNC